MSEPTSQIHQKIESMLHRSGWCVQMFSAVDQGSVTTLAIRDFPLAHAYGLIDYLLFIEGKAVGLIEVKNDGSPLFGIPVQSEKYRRGLPFSLRLYTRPLPFLYQTNGNESFFTNGFDPEPTPRRLHGFHRPETLQSWLTDGMVGEIPRDMAADYFPEYRRRGRTFHERVLINMPDLVTQGLSNIEVKSVQTLEAGLKKNKRRILMTLATGSKHPTIIGVFVERLLRYVDARRILILVDDEKDIDRLMSVFQDPISAVDDPLSPKSFCIQVLTEDNLDDPKTRVCISTLALLAQLLRARGENSLPIETFEVILLDECSDFVLTHHRQVLAYFDAYCIGFSETPKQELLDFFQQDVSAMDQEEDGLKVISNIP